MSQAGMESWPYDYERLKDVFLRSEMVCDPVEFSYRQHRLLKGLAMYLLERDKHKETKDDC